MNNNNNNLNKSNIYSFSLRHFDDFDYSLNNDYNYPLNLVKSIEKTKVAKIMSAAFWDESNGIFCDECGAQVNYWKNPHSDIFVESYSAYDDLQEEEYKELKEDEKLLYKKCADCFSYKKITSEKKEFSDCCKIKNTFKILNGSILKKN